MKTCILSALVVFSLLVSSAAPSFAQLVSDPNDRLYTDLELWMDRGLTDKLPPLRPYPVQLVVKTLHQVAAKGNDADQKLATFYLSRVEGGSKFHAVASALGRTVFSSSYLQLGLEGSMQGSINPWMTYSAQLGAVGLSSFGNELLPEYQRSTLDFVQDTGVTSVKGIYPRMSMIGSATLGNDATYFQAGAIRGSYGPFWGDNAVLSPTSPQSGQFSFVFHDNAMSGTILLMDISATDSSGGSLSPEKFLSIGGLEFYPFDWLTLGVFDAMVWGQRFDPLYVLPVVSFYTEGMAGYPDNAFIGISGGVKLPGALKANFILYVDDAAFNDLIRLNFNTMLLVSFQLGVSWTPNLPYLTRLSVTNLLITPYTYSHENYGNLTSTDPNYLNYTNNGQNIGPSIQPNSDRIEVDALIRPVDWVDLNVFSRFIIHGNASAGIPQLAGNDGSINDTGINSTGVDYFHTLRFLSQSVLEKVIQAGFGTTAYLETPVGEIRVDLGYTFEYILDGSVVGTGPVSGNDATNNYVSLGVTFTY